MKKNRLTFLFFTLLLTASFPLSVAAQDNFGNIDAMLEENKLNSAANRYASVMASFLPEQAAKIGLSPIDGKLNNRSARHQTLAVSALRSVLSSLDEIDSDLLTPAKRADKQILKESLERDLLSYEQDRYLKDPLYYAEVFDTLYDAWLSPAASVAHKKTALRSLLAALPAVADQAEQNLIAPATFLSQQAMERAYYAYLSFDEITNFLLSGEDNEFTLADDSQSTLEAKRAIKRMFDLFKRLSQEKASQDFRLGAEDFARRLNRQYQIPLSPEKLTKQLEEDLLASQKNLAAMLDPFLQALPEEETVTLVEDLNAQPTVEDTPKEEPKKTKKKAKKSSFVPPTAQDFYAVAKRLTEDTQAPQGDPTHTFASLANDWAYLLAERKVLPPLEHAISVKAMPQFYAYFYAYLFTPAYGAGAEHAAFYLRLPSGNQLNKDAQVKKDFNEPTMKLTVAGQLTPGRYYQAVAHHGVSALRRLYPSPATANAWSGYAKQIAKEQGLIVTDEELLFLSWDEYRRVLAALVDVKLHTKQFSYTDAINFLVQKNGFEQAEAEGMLKFIAAYPAQTASIYAAEKALLSLRKSVQKKQGKKYSDLSFHTKLLKAGNLSPEWMEKEVLRLYEEEK